jgi:hypothetical protein
LNAISSYTIKISIIEAIESTIRVVGKVTSIKIRVIKTIGIGSVVGIVKSPTIRVVSSSKTTVKATAKIPKTKTETIVEKGVIA